MSKKLGKREIDIIKGKIELNKKKVIELENAHADANVIEKFLNNVKIYEKQLEDAGL